MKKKRYRSREDSAGNIVDIDNAFVLKGKCLDYDPDTNVITLFQNQVKKSPQNVACQFEQEILSYRQLDDLSSQCCQYLIQSGVKPGAEVAFYMERSIEVLVVILGILKAGAAYVPLDVSYPQHYLDTIFDIVEPSLLICGSQTYSTTHCRVVNYSDFEKQLSNLSIDPHRYSIRPSDTAYVLFTSGSTGKPKGVKIPHSQLTNCMLSYCDDFPLDESEVVAQRTTLSFAVSAKELYTALISGASIAIIPNISQTNLGDICAYIERHQITRISLLPSYLDLIVQVEGAAKTLSSLKYLLAAGEPLRADQVKRVIGILPSSRVINNYGCTEMGDLCVSEVDLADIDGLDSMLSFGLPIANCNIYILDENMLPVTDGEIGSLYAAGRCLSSGYYNDDEKTQQAYLKNSFSQNPSQRMFKTGDIGRRNKDGSLELLGRNDFLLKIRGFRVDVQHVEKILVSFPGLETCLVSGTDNSQLAAYYIAKKEKLINKHQLAAYVREKLPDYMCPSWFIGIEDIPRLPNGKVDRKRLRDPISFTDVSDSGSEPKTASEELLAKIWSQVLGISPNAIGSASNFFDLGGDSLSTFSLALQINEDFSIDLSGSDIFDHPALYQMVALIDSHSAGERQKIADSDLASSLESPTRETYQHPVFPNFYWFNQFATARTMIVAVRYRCPFGSTDKIKYAMESMLKEQDQLRASWLKEDDAWLVNVRSVEELSLWLTEETSSENALDEKLSHVLSEFTKVVEFSKKLFHVCYIKTTDSDCDYVFFMFHHLLLDMFSTKIFMLRFQHYFDGEDQQLSKRKHHAGSIFANHWQGYANLRAMEMADYWLNRDWSSLIQPAFDGDNHSIQFDEYGLVESHLSVHKLSTVETQSFWSAVRQSGYSEIILILTSVFLAYERWCGAKTLFMHINTSNRNIDGIDLSYEIGWYAQFAHLFFEANSSLGKIETLRCIKQQYENVMSEHSLSYTCLRYMVKDDDVKKKMQLQPWPQIALNYKPRNIDLAHGNFIYTRNDVFALPELCSPILTYEYDEDQCLNLCCDYTSSSYKEETVNKFMQDQKGILLELARQLST